MRRLLVVCLLAAFATPGVWAQGMRPPPTEAQTQAAVLLSRAGPQTRAFVAREARAPDLTEASARQAALSEGAELGATSPGDIDALVAMVLLQASEEAGNELSDMQAQMQSINAQKQRLRDQDAEMKAAQAAANAQATRAVATMSRPEPIAPQSAAPGLVHQTTGVYGASGYRPVPPQVPPNAGGRLDSMNEMSETESMRLQMAMDRRSKFVEALSNVMTKIATTDAAITKNLK
jgi:hypothetical protein